MMEGENVKAFALPFVLPLPRGSTPSPIFHRGLCWRPKSFDEFIRHQIQALIVCFFIIKDKERAPRWRRTEASHSGGQNRKGYQNGDSIKIPACAGSDSYRMTTVLGIIPMHHAI